MKANPYFIDKAVKGKGRRLDNIDFRSKDFDEKWLQDLLIRHPIFFLRVKSILSSIP